MKIGKKIAEPLQEQADTATEQNAQTPEPETSKEDAKKQKKKERDRAYYLRNIGKIQERARNKYQKKQDAEKAAEKTAEKAGKHAEKHGKSKTAEGNSGISIPLALFALAGTAIIVMVLARRQSKQGTSMPVPTITFQRSRKFDIGNGEIIEIPV